MKKNTRLRVNTILAVTFEHEWEANDIYTPICRYCGVCDHYEGDIWGAYGLTPRKRHFLCEPCAIAKGMNLLPITIEGFGGFWDREKCISCQKTPSSLFPKEMRWEDFAHVPCQSFEFHWEIATKSDFVRDFTRRSPFLNFLHPELERLVIDYLVYNFSSVKNGHEIQLFLANKEKKRSRRRVILHVQTGSKEEYFYAYRNIKIAKIRRLQKQYETILC